MLDDSRPAAGRVRAFVRRRRAILAQVVNIMAFYTGPHVRLARDVVRTLRGVFRHAPAPECNSTARISAAPSVHAARAQGQRRSRPTWRTYAPPSCPSLLSRHVRCFVDRPPSLDSAYAVRIGSAWKSLAEGESG